MRHNGTIYLVEVETDEKKEREENMSAREKQMCYWGLKFEDYMTQRGNMITSVGFSILYFVSFWSIWHTK